MQTLPPFIKNKIQEDLLSQEEEVELAKNIQEKNCQESKEILFNSNLKLVSKLANKYSYSSEYAEDLFNEGCVGLWNAVLSYKPIGAKFSSFAHYLIVSKICKYLNKNSRTVYIPAYSYNRLKTLNKIKQDFISENGCHPTPQQLSDISGIRLSEVEQLTDLCGSKVSFDKNFDDSEENLYDIFYEEESFSSTNLQDLKKQIIEACCELTEKERLVVEKRFGINCDKALKFKEIGQILGLTKQRAEQINSIALAKMKNTLTNKGIKDLQYI